MRLSDLNPNLDPSLLADGDVVGLVDLVIENGFIADLVKGATFVAHYDGEGGVYTCQVTLDEFIETGEGWEMTEDEAFRVGIKDYDAYVKSREENGNA